MGTNALTSQQQEQWNENGFVLLEGFYSAERIAETNALIDRLWRERKSLDNRYVIDIFVETEREQRVYFADAPSGARFAPYKLNDLFLSCPLIRDMIVGDRLAPILNELLGGAPLVCNTLNFEYGSQQDYHFDTFYMPSPTPNKMVASWLALEDATTDNGPLSYYPGSHKIPPYLFSNGRTIVMQDEMPAFREYIFQQIDERGLKPETLYAKKGDLLIWHSQLFHGGSPIKDKRKTRKSLVTHYFTREDFPELEMPYVGKHGSYMSRPAQPVAYPFKPKSWWQKLMP